LKVGDVVVIKKTAWAEDLAFINEIGILTSLGNRHKWLVVSVREIDVPVMTVELAPSLIKELF
jgi:hypothetical protein